MGVPVILTEHPDRARKFGNILIDKALSLSSFPERGRVVPELNDPSVREIIHGHYRIIYEVLRSPDAVYVLRFWHAAKSLGD